MKNSVPRRFRVPEIVLGFFLGVLAFVFLAGPLSYQATNCTDHQSQSSQNAPRAVNPKPPTAHENGEHGDGKVGQSGKGHAVACGLIGFIPSVIGFMDHHEGFFVGGFTSLLFAATMLLWRSTNALWEAGERQIAHLEGSAERQLRAYVSVEIKGVTLTPLGGNLYSLVVNYVRKNSGQTPASEVTTDTEFQVLPFPLPQNLNIADPIQNVVPYRHRIDPGQAPPGETEKPIRLNPFTMRDRGERMYVIGLLTYLDAFGKKRRTEFCGSLIGLEEFAHSIPSTQGVLVRFHWAELYNEAT